MNEMLFSRLMFDFERLDKGMLSEEVEGLSPKILRWFGANHPDNKTRKFFFEKTGVKIGVGTIINQGFIVSDDYNELLTIGSRVAIAPNVTIVCSSNANNSKLREMEGFESMYHRESKVHICDDAWIGTGVIILPGVSVGKGVLVAAGSVVTKSVPDFSLARGVPAKVVYNIKGRLSASRD